MERLPETCSEILATLPLFAGYDLEAPEMEAVAGHLERCDDCREACDRARDAREVLGSLREPEASRGAGPDLWAGVRSQLVDEGLLASGPRVARPFASSRWWMGSAAAAAAVILVGLLGRSDGPVSEVPVRSEQPAVADSSGSPGLAGSGETTVADRTETPAGPGHTPGAPEGGAVSRPSMGALVGQGGAAVGSPLGDHATIAPEGSAGRELRRLEAGELGLYEQALRESAHAVPVQVQNGRQQRLRGIR